MHTVNIYRIFDESEIKDIFSYHAPTGEQQKKYEGVNAAFIECANTVARLMPEGPGRTAAIRKLAEARMACNGAIALEGKF